MCSFVGLNCSSACVLTYNIISKKRRLINAYHLSCISDYNRSYTEAHCNMCRNAPKPEICFPNTRSILFCNICMYVGFKTLFYVVRHPDSTASHLPTGLHLHFFRSWPSLYLPSSFGSVFLVLSFVSASTSMLFWVIFLLPFFGHGRTMYVGSVQFLL